MGAGSFTGGHLFGVEVGCAGGGNGGAVIEVLPRPEEVQAPAADFDVALEGWGGSAGSWGGLVWLRICKYIGNTYQSFASS